MKKIAFILLLFPVLSWANMAPTCSDEKVINFIKSYALKNITDTVNNANDQSQKDVLKYMVFSVEDIRTQKINRELGSYYCGANLKIIALGEEFASLSMNYHVELAANSKDGFYVTFD